MNKNKGITLIALVITIIVLLILAAVGINLLLGESGIIERTRQAKFFNEFKSVEEKIMLYKTGEELKKYTEGDTNKNIIDLLPISEQVTDEEKNSFKESLKNEIKKISQKSNLDQVNLYKIDKAKAQIVEKHNYIIDIDTLQIYDIDGEKYEKIWHHAIANKTIMDDGEENPKYDEVEEDNKRVWTQVGTKVSCKINGVEDAQVLEVGEKVLYDCMSEDATKLSYSSPSQSNGYSDQTFKLQKYTGDRYVSEDWYVLGAENGKLLLLSSAKAQDKYYTDNIYARKALTFGYTKGYKNYISELDKIASLYGQSKYVESSRSITMDDINRVTGYDPENTGYNKYTNAGTNLGKYQKLSLNEYGNGVTYYWKDANECPEYTSTNGCSGTAKAHNLTESYVEEEYRNGFIYFENENWIYSGYDNTNVGNKTINNNPIKGTSYEYCPETLTTTKTLTARVGINQYDLGKRAYDAIFGKSLDEPYWVATRSQKHIYDQVYYEIFNVGGNGRVVTKYLATSNGNKASWNFGVRAVVTLKSNVELKETSEGSGIYSLSFAEE